MTNSASTIKEITTALDCIFQCATTKKGQSSKIISVKELEGNAVKKAQLAEHLYSMIDVLKGAKQTIQVLGDEIGSLNKKLDAQNQHSDAPQTVIKEVVDEMKKDIIENVVPEIVKATMKESDKKWTDLFDTSKKEMKKQSSEANEQRKALEKSIISSKN